MPPIFKWLHTFRRRNVTLIILIPAARVGRAEITPIWWRIRAPNSLLTPSPALSPAHATGTSSFLSLSLTEPGLWSVAADPLLRRAASREQSKPEPQLGQRVPLEEVCI